MNTYCGVRSSRPAWLFSFGLLDVLLRVRLRRPQLRGATAGFGLSRLATASMDNPGLVFASPRSFGVKRCRDRVLPMRVAASRIMLAAVTVSAATGLWWAPVFAP